MEKQQLIKSIYVYALLITSIIILMVNSVSTLTSLVDMVYPTPYIQTFEEFSMSKQNSLPQRPVSINPTQSEPTPATVAVTATVLDAETTRADYASYKTETTKREQRDVLKRIIKNIIWVLASACLLWFSLREKRLLHK